MVKKIIFGIFLYTVMIASVRALQRLFHWGSGSNGLAAFLYTIMITSTRALKWLFHWYVKM